MINDKQKTSETNNDDDRTGLTFLNTPIHTKKKKETIYVYATNTFKSNNFYVECGNTILFEALKIWILSYDKRIL